MSKDQKQNAGWDIDERVGRRFLQALDPDPVRAEARFERVRRKLIAYISRGLGSFKQANPQDLADETIRRAARKIGEEGVKLTSTIETYCVGIAHHVLQEYWKTKTSRGKEEQFDEVPNKAVEGDDEPWSVNAYLNDRNLTCLKLCLEKHFSQLEIAAILKYHDVQEEPGKTKQIRKTLAMRLKTSPKNLSNRMDRHREKLLDCIKICLDEENTEDKGSSHH